MKTTGTVDDWFQECERWSAEVAELRAIVLGCGLSETLKWGQPTYTDDGRNILIVSTLKDCATVSFMRGALLHDPQGRLVQPGEHSRSVRYLRFTEVSQVRAQRAELEAFVAQAVQLARSGTRVEKPKGELELVEELQERMDADPDFRQAFEALTPGRQRAYNIHIGGAKNSSTRQARIDRHTERILAGKGINDCICGHSKRMPRCDGSHKQYR